NVRSAICCKDWQGKDLMLKRKEIDLNSQIVYRHSKRWKGMAHEFGSDDLCTSDGFSPAAGVSPVCRALPGRLQGPELFLLGSVSLSGFCTTHRARKFARYRSLFAFATG